MRGDGRDDARPAIPRVRAETRPSTRWTGRQNVRRKNDRQNKTLPNIQSGYPIQVDTAPERGAACTPNSVGACARARRAQCIFARAQGCMCSHTACSRIAKSGYQMHVRRFCLTSGKSGYQIQMHAVQAVVVRRTKADMRRCRRDDVHAGISRV